MMRNCIQQNLYILKVVLLPNKMFTKYLFSIEPHDSEKSWCSLSYITPFTYNSNDSASYSTKY